MKGFTIEQNASEKYIITFIGHDVFDDTCFYYSSSYIVLQARLLGLSYPDYLIYCQSKGATLKGRNGYCTPFWEDKSSCQEVCNLLEKNWQTLIKAIKFK